MATRNGVEQGDALVLKWLEAIEGRDEYTAGHCRRVRDYALALAARVGYPESRLGALDVASLLHDVGKIVIPESILNKPCALTAWEWRRMRRHPDYGERIVKRLGLGERVAGAVRWHHERWDGGGYPDGLSGRRIPLEARIVRIADEFDALTTLRSYRAPLSWRSAVRVLAADAGRSTDPALVAPFIQEVTELRGSRRMVR